MLVLVASRLDPSASQLVAQWAAYDARLLTCEDLSRKGWRHHMMTPDLSIAQYCKNPSGRDSCAVIGGEQIPVREITGVLTRLTWVTEAEVEHIAEQDRAYVAAEMNAFLLAWLAGLECPVLNRPTPLNLAGPGLRYEEWVWHAAQLGIPIISAERRAVFAADAPTRMYERGATVIIVGNHCIGDCDAALHQHARRLAASVGADLLAIHFSSPEKDARFLGVDLFPDFGDVELQNAVLEYLMRPHDEKRTRSTA